MGGECRQNGVVTALVETLTAIHRRFESMRFVSQPEIHVVNRRLGINLAIGSEGAPTHHFIASATKPMLAVALLRQLAASGLSVDAHLAEIMPHEIVGIPHGEKLTVMHLLTHASGMFDYWSVHGLAAHRGSEPLVTWANAHPGWSIDDVIELTRRHPAAAEPGEKFAYCGTNYQFATRVLETLSGRPATEALRALVFEPAGMADTYLFATDNLARFDSISTVLLGSEIYRAGRRMASLSGEGGVVSTTSDTNRFLDWVERGEAIDGGWESLMVRSRRFSPGVDYGLGVMRATLPRVLTGWTSTPTGFGHYGMTGYAMMSIPKTGWHISTTTNQMAKQFIGVRLYAAVLGAVSRIRHGQ